MIRIVWGVGTARTAKASFDAALADATIHQYNLRQLSSVIPAETALELTGDAPDLGPAGNVLDVVMARQTSEPGHRASAGLAWVREASETTEQADSLSEEADTSGQTDGPGIFYEVEDHDPETVEKLLRTGIEHGCELRGLDSEAVETKVVTAESSPDEYTTATAVAVYGESTSLL